MKRPSSFRELSNAHALAETLVVWLLLLTVFGGVAFLAYIAYSLPALSEQVSPESCPAGTTVKMCAGVRVFFIDESAIAYDYTYPCGCLTPEAP